MFASALLIGGSLAFGTSPSMAVQSHDPDPGPAPGSSEAAEFQQVTLAKGPEEVGEPATLALLPDGSALHTSREGTVRVTDRTGETTLAGEIPVYSHDEEGLQGVGVDPGFDENRFVYLYYAPPMETPEGDAPETGSAADFEPFEGVNRLARFVLGEDGKLDMDSEKKILDVDADRGQCCHVGGDIAFDGDGNLLLSTGDDGNPFQSDGYTPTDERKDRNPVFDSQRSAGNTNDLRGKLLRINVKEDGSYDTPEGNLFEPGTEKTRPEIYAMGFRNPFRISVDKPTGTVYVGDYGPDAGKADPDRGPAGQVEFNRVTEAGNFGWPYCTGDNDAYTDYDFADESSGEKYDCAKPQNDSPHNTGLTELPEAKPAWIPYDGPSVPEFGDGSESPMGGPVYRYDENLDSDVKFPEEYSGDFFAGEFGREWIKRIEQNEDGGGRVINDFPWSGTQVMDMEFGPDGALYVLDYGTGYFAGDDNSALYRIENATNGHTPVARAAADVSDGQAPLDVAFSSEGTEDGDGEELKLEWDFGDGETSTEADPEHTYTENGTYSATLTATDPTGRVGTAGAHVTVGNTAPEVELELPADGQLFSFGDEIPFKVKVTDAEDKEIDCSKVDVTYILGHDSHGHPITSAKGCEGTVKTSKDGEHDANADIFGVFDAEYTDGGANDQPPLTSHGQSVLQPAHRQAEHFDESEGVKAVSQEGANGGKAVGEIHDGDWAAFEPYALGDATELSARVSSGGPGGKLEIRAGKPDGTLLGTADVPSTGGGTKYEDVKTAIEKPPAESTTLYLVFKGEGSEPLYTVDDFTFTTG